MSCEFRILDYNYAFSSLTTTTASSEDSNFPVSNLAKYSRASVWRSAGTYVVGSSNKLDINYNGLGAVAASVTAGSYTRTEFTTAVSEALSAAAGAAITVSYSLGKFTIACSGSSLSLLFSSGTNAASSMHASLGFATQDYTAALTYTGPKRSIHTEESVVFDLMTAEEIDSVAVLFSPLDGIKLTREAVVTIQGSATNHWDSPGISQALTYDETYGHMTHFFATASEYRYWRLKIVDAENPDLYVEIPKVFLSKATQLTQGPDIGFTVDKTMGNASVRTSYGVKYTDIYPRLSAYGFTLNALDSADVETLDLMHERVGDHFPVFISLDSTGDLWDKDRFAVYGVLKGSFKTSQVFYSYFNTTLSLEEIF